MEQTAKKLRADSDDLRLHVDLWSGFVMANMLWALLGAAIITLPLAMLGIFAVMSERVRGRHPETIHTFFAAIRQKGRTAMFIGGIDFVAGAFITVNLIAISRIGLDNPMAIPSGAVTLFCAIVLLSANIYLWPLLALENLPVRRLIEMSLRFALGYPFHTFAILLAAAVPVAVSLLLPRGVLVLLTASCVAYIVAWGSWRVIRRHLTSEELQTYTARGI